MKDLYGLQGTNYGKDSYGHDYRGENTTAILQVQGQ